MNDNNHNYWDRKFVHFCTESYQSCQDVSCACGIKLSTWTSPDLPWKQSGNKYGTIPHPEKDLGYSFTTAPVNCPECVKWMEEHLNRCKQCNAIAQYTYCEKCAEELLDREEKKAECPGIKKWLKDLEEEWAKEDKK